MTNVVEEEFEQTALAEKPLASITSSLRRSTFQTTGLVPITGIFELQDGRRSIPSRPQNTSIVLATTVMAIQ